MQECDTEGARCIEAYRPQTLFTEKYSQAVANPQGHKFLQWKRTGWALQVESLLTLVASSENTIIISLGGKI